MAGNNEKVIVSTYTNGILDPGEPMLGPVRDGGLIEANTMPGCWGPMITPHLRGGHEVTQPVYVENAEPGDAIAIRIREINVTSVATASGQDRMVDGHFLGDPFVAKKCPGCGTMYPETIVEGIGQDAVRCSNCGTPVTPFQFEHGYTVVFDEGRTLGVTMDKDAAERIARDAKKLCQAFRKLHTAFNSSFCPARSRRNYIQNETLHGSTRDNACRENAGFSQRR